MMAILFASQNYMNVLYDALAFLHVKEGLLIAN